MDHKKDIGTLLKQKLDGAVKEPNAGLWDKIEGSLDKRDRKRRSFFFFWVGTGTTAIILLLLYLNSATSEGNDLELAVPKAEITTKPGDNVSATSDFNSEKNNAILPSDSIAGDRMSELEQKKLNNLISSEDNSEIPNKNKVIKGLDPFMDDSVTIKTTYHYYNGDTKQMLETTDKSVIDSLLERTQINIDSLKVVETKILIPRKGDSIN
jgi:hypothetical protein